jgi:DNA-directed RNA polymerase subunit RPC12/RpoP
MGIIVAKWICGKCGNEMSVIDYNYRVVDLCTRCGNRRKIPPRPPYQNLSKEKNCCDGCKKNNTVK